MTVKYIVSEPASAGSGNPAYSILKVGEPRSAGAIAKIPASTCRDTHGNAKFVCRAMNAHDPLVTACRALLEIVTAERDCFIREQGATAGAELDEDEKIRLIPDMTKLTRRGIENLAGYDNAIRLAEIALASTKIGGSVQ